MKYLIISWFVLTIVLLWCLWAYRPVKDEEPYIERTEIFDSEGKLVAAFPHTGDYIGFGDGMRMRKVYWSDGKVEVDVR